jgi:hypothetical protein
MEKTEIKRGTDRIRNSRHTESGRKREKEYKKKDK